MTSPPRRVLVVKPGSLGDVVHALPVASALRKAWPQAEISWVIDPRWAPLLGENPAITQTVPFPRQQFRGVLGLGRAVPWAVGLRHLKPDLCLDLQGLLRSGLIARCAGSRHILCLSDAREGATWFAHRRVPVERGEHSVLRYLRSCDTLAIERPSPPEFPLPAGQLPTGVHEGEFVAIHPFSRGAGKSLAVDSLHALCRGLEPMPVVLLGGACAENESFPPWVTNLLGRTSLMELVAILRRAACLVSVDSGPAHIAAALGTPLIAIHSWSDPSLVGPFSKQAWIWQNGTLRLQDFQPGSPGPLPSPAQAAEIAAKVLSLC